MRIFLKQPDVPEMGMLCVICLLVHACYYENMRDIPLGLPVRNMMRALEGPDTTTSYYVSSTSTLTARTDLSMKYLI